MENQNFNSSPSAQLLAAQLETLFATGVVRSFSYHRTGAPVVSLPGVVDSFPARLSGVNPGDTRVRMRSDDLDGILSPGSPDYITDTNGVSMNVVSAAVEFGGLGVALQCRRRGPEPQGSGEPVATFLAVPYMSRTVRDLMTELTVGTLIFQTDQTPGLRVFNGTSWVRFQEIVEE